MSVDPEKWASEGGEVIDGKNLTASHEVRTAYGWKRITRLVNGGFQLEGSEKLNDYDIVYVGRLVPKSIDHIKRLEHLILEERKKTNVVEEFDTFAKRLAIRIEQAISEGFFA